MAQLSISSKTFSLASVLAVLAAAVMVSAQDSGMASAPAPGLDTGAGFSLPVSSAFAVFSVVVSLLALWRH
uniref:Uncharacterized protein n=1 Tax=Rhizophora mucronata TaxID=61149 RepID=A0A2P2KAF9_RHIMU